MKKMIGFLLCALPLLLLAGCVTAKSKDEVVRKCLAEASQRERTGDFQGALDQLNEALALDPKNGGALARRGMVKTKLNDTEGALQDFNLAISNDADNSNYSAYLGRGLMYRQLKDTDKSLADLNKAIELAPNMPQLHMARGRTYAEAGLEKKAAEDFSRALEFDPTAYEAHMDRAYAYKALKQNDRAISDLNYVQLHSKDPVLVQRARELLDELSEETGK